MSGGTTHDALVGGRLGRYPISGLIGKGGMATVYLGRHPGLDQPVAIKVLHPHLATDPAFIGRFHHEAAAVAALRHPNIVRVYDFDDVDGTYFMVMEFIDGPALSARLAQRAATGHGLATEEILRVFPPLCSAVDYAAGQGMVHRDIKPANIMLTSGGVPVLTDYGIARIAGATSYTTPGTVIGSAHYMSPEQIEGGECDLRSDLYSLAVVLFEALTGRVPFDAPTTSEVLAQHLLAPVPSVLQRGAELPEAVEPLVQRALAKQPDARYPTGGHLAEALQAALAAATGPPATTVIVPLTGATGVASELPTSVEPPVVEPEPPTRLEPAVPGERIAPPVVPAPSPYPPPERRSRARRAAAIAAVALVVATILGLAALLVARSGDGTTSTTTSVTTVPVTQPTPLTTPPPTPLTTPPPATPATPPTTTVPPGLSPSAATLLAEGDALLATGRLQEAEARYQQVVQAHPDHAQTLVQLGIAFQLQPEKSELARAQFERATELAPDDARAWAFLGFRAFVDAYREKSGQYGPAEDALATAVRLDPDSALAHAFLARVRVAQGRLDEAAAEEDQALALAPDEPWVRYALGWAEGLRDEWAVAVEHYRVATTLQPNWAYFQLALSEALANAGRYDDSIATSRAVLALHQGYDAAAYGRMGYAQLQKGDLDAAISSYEQSIAIDDNDDYTRWGLGSAHFRKGDYPAALPHLQLAADLSPNNPGYHNWLSACLFELERYPESKAEAERALQLDPGLTDAQERLDELAGLGY